MDSEQFSRHLLDVARLAQHSDRGMRKWRPFASIPEQHTGLNNVMNELYKVDQPLLTADQQEQINHTINKAIHFKKPVQITHYKDGKIATGLGVITHVNDRQQTLYYIDEVFNMSCNLPLSSLVDISIK